MMTQWEFTAPFEGVIPHLYLDTRGNVTCGVGFLLANRAAVDAYEWHPNLNAAHADYDKVRVMAPGHVASYYASACTAHLTDETMHEHFDRHVASVRSQLASSWHLADLPRDAQIALVDMAFNLGVAGLDKFKKLHAAVDARDWATAATECSRKGVQQARNDATRDLFLGLVGGNVEAMNVEVNDIIQLAPEQSPWGPLLMIVSEVKTWGVQAYALIPEERDKPPSAMFLRAEFGRFVVVGRAVWASSSAQDEQEV